jgi:predicted PurR-regulated permease PerM
MQNTANRLVILLVGLASIFIIIWGINYSAYIINTLLLAVVITITILPMPAWFKHKGLPSWLSLVLTILIVAGVIALVLFLIVFSVTKLATEIPTYLASMAERQSEVTATPEQTQTLGTQAETLISPEIVLQIVNKIVAIVVPVIAQVAMVLLIFVFMLAAAFTLPAVTRRGLPVDAPILGQVEKFTEDVRQYITVMTVINFLVGLGDTIFLWIVGVDFAILWGLLAWFLGYIPTIGFWLAMIPPLILAWAQFGVQTALIVFLGYVLINGSVGNFVQPKMMGDRLKISPVVVFVSLFVWGWLLGGIGAILSVPMTMIVLAVLENFESTRWLVLLVRATPERQEGERKAALERLKGTWGSVRNTAMKTVGMSPDRMSGDKGG